MVPNRKVGGGHAAAARVYRHPLVASMTAHLPCLVGLEDAAASRRVRWTPLAASVAALLMAFDSASPLAVRCEEARRCLRADFTRSRRVGGTYNGLMKALERQAPQVLPGDALLLGDGNFVGYPLWSALHQAGHAFLIRVGGNIGLIRELFPQARIEHHGDIVYVWPAAHRHNHPSLRMRLIRVGGPHEEMFLLTNVFDRRQLSISAAGKIYRKRWGVELFYRTFKRTLHCAKARSRSARRGRIELEWGLIALTILTLMGLHALHRGQRDLRRLSPAVVVRAVRSVLRRGEHHPSPRAAAELRNALGRAWRDDYQRRAAKQF